MNDIICSIKLRFKINKNRNRKFKIHNCLCRGLSYLRDGNDENLNRDLELKVSFT